MKLLVRFEFCLVLATTLAWAGPFENGLAAFDQQQFATALTLWLPLAQQGDRTAQFRVGVLYEKGLGVDADPAEAARWYLKAAQQGDTEAQYNVGVMYETGTGLGKDIAEARKWYAAVMTNPSTAGETSKIKERARERLDILRSVVEIVVPYKGGRFVVVRSSSGACAVALQGTITKDTASRFDDVIRRGASLGCSNPLLLLESPGGLVFDALDLGIEIRHAGFRTVTRSACASACALIFLGGTERILVGSLAKIGLHQPARGDGPNRVCDPTTYTSVAHDMASYLKSVIPEHADEVMSLMMQTSCTDIQWIFGQRALDMDIATRVE
jgi:ATP-dependent protease ClpP protease subunit